MMKNLLIHLLASIMLLSCRQHESSNLMQLAIELPKPTRKDGLSFRVLIPSTNTLYLLSGVSDEVTNTICFELPLTSSAEAFFFIDPGSAVLSAWNKPFKAAPESNETIFIPDKVAKVHFQLSSGVVNSFRLKDEYALSLHKVVNEKIDPYFRMSSHLLSKSVNMEIWPADIGRYLVVVEANQKPFFVKEFELLPSDVGDSLESTLGKKIEISEADKCGSNYVVPTKVPVELGKLNVLKLYEKK